MAQPTPPPGSSTVTKVLFFVAVVFWIVAGLSLPFSWGSAVTTDAGILAGVFTGIGGAYHVFFDAG